MSISVSIFLIENLALSCNYVIKIYWMLYLDGYGKLWLMFLVKTIKYEISWLCDILDDSEQI